MLFRPSTKTRFRNAAIGAGLVTLAAVSAFPAAAEQKTIPVATSTEEVTVNTNCHDYKPGVLMADTKCEILKGRALDAQAKMLADERVCITKLLEFKKASPAKFEELGSFTRATACEAASRIPKPTANAAGPRAGS